MRAFLIALSTARIMLQEDFTHKDGSWIQSGVEGIKHIKYSAGNSYQDRFRDRGLYADSFGNYAISKALALPRGRFAIRF